MTSFSSQKLQTFARRLGLTPEALSRCLGAPTHEEGQRRLEGLRERLRGSYREECLRCHPDRNPDDPEKAEEFKQFTAAYSEIKDLLAALDVTENVQFEEYRTEALRVTVVRDETPETPFSANWWER